MKRTALWRLLTVLTILSLVIGSVQVLVASPTADKGGTPRYSLGKDAEGTPIAKVSPATAPGDTVRVFVRLSDPALAEYRGSIAGIPKAGLTAAKKLDLASPAAKAYVSYLEGKQSSFKATLAKAVPSATIWGSTRLTSNGLALVVAKKDVAALRKLPGVASVIAEKLIPVDMDAVHSVYQTSVVWNALGGQNDAGRGMKIAIIDTGADPDAPMYNDAGFTAPPGYPRGDLRYTNNKLIVARSYIPPYGPVQSAMDEGGHSTFIGGVAGGVSVQADFSGYATTVSGMAPGAFIMTYNVAVDPELSSLSSLGILLALDDVLADDADVVNMSFGSTAGPIELDSMAAPLKALTDAGVVAVTSAGNSGPTAETAQQSPSTLPWVIAVGATDNTRFLGPVKLDVTGPAPVPDNLLARGATILDFSTEFTTVGPAAYMYEGLGCSALTDDLTGKIALISRGTCNFTVKTKNALDKGAIGVVIINNVAGGPPVGGAGTLSPSLPTIMIGADDGLAVRNFATANPGATLQFAMGGAAVDIPSETMVSFSSRGPGALFQIKPDLVAVGANVLSQCQNNNPDGFACYSSTYWVTGQGTSYSTPMVTGAAALLKQLHPDWTPAQIKSALMTTAKRSVFTDYAHTAAANIMTQGAGQMDLSKAGDPGLTFDKPSFSFGMINLANETGAAVRSTTIVATDVRAAGVAGDLAYDVSVTELVGAPGMVTVTAAPAALTFGAAGATQSLNLNIEVNPAAAAGTYSGYVNVNRGSQQNHIPYWVRVINKNVTGNILVVDDDRNAEEYGGTYDTSAYYADVLTNLEETFTIWNTLSYGPPTLADMQKAQAVIWFTGLDFESTLNNLPTLTTVELDAVFAYLNAGGRLLVTGQDLIGSSVYWEEGLGTILHTDWLQDSIYDPTYDGIPAPRPSMTGFTNDPIGGGLVIDVDWDKKGDGNWPDSFGGEFATDEALPRASEGAYPILTVQGIAGAYPLGIGAVGGRASSEPTLEAASAYAGRTVWLGFGLENVNNDTGFNTREELLGSILDWLRDDVTASLTSTIAPAGQTSVFTAAADASIGVVALYRWDFGDGYPLTTTDRNWAPHVYRNPGVYTVRVEITDSLLHTVIATQTVTVPGPTPDLSTSTKVVNKATASPEEKVTYTLTIKNSGPAMATDPRIVDAIPAGTTFVAGSTTGGAVFDAATNTITWGGAGPLAAGAEHSISFKVMVNADTAVGTVLVNTATFKDVRTNVEVSKSATTTVVPQPVITPAMAADTYLDQWRPANNYGADGRLMIRASDVQAPLMKWDLAALPAGATIKKAELKLYAAARTNTGPTTVGIFQMLSPWNDLAATWLQADAGVAWDAAGANGAADRSTTAVSPKLLTTATTWYTFDITSIAQNWANGDANDGVALKYVSGDVMVAYTFASSSYLYAPMRPVLTIQYVNP